MIEILVVVTIIVIIMAFLIPAAGSVLKRAKISKTRTAIRNLQLAIKQYEATYSVLPFTSSIAVDTVLNAGNYNDLLQTLAALNQNFNPRLIAFLGLDANNLYQDSWENDFFVTLDLDYTGTLDDAAVHGIGQLSTNLAIWSRGPDGLESATDGSADNEDNINSWDE